MLNKHKKPVQKQLQESNSHKMEQNQCERRSRALDNKKISLLLFNLEQLADSRGLKNT